MSNATRNRGVLVLTCVLVALGSLLCVEKESLAKPPGKAPEPGGSATSHRPAGVTNADHRAPAARPKPAHPKRALREPADRGPTEQRPAGRHGGTRHPVEPPGRQGVQHGKAAHEQRPVHEPPGLREHGRGRGPQEPVGPDPKRHHPQPEQANKDNLSRPVHERPSPQKTPHYPHGSGSTGQQEGAGSPDQHGKLASPPGKENIHPEKKSFAGPREQTRQPPEHGKAAVPKPEKTAGNSAYKRANPDEQRPVYKSPTHTGTSANTPDGRPPSVGSIGTQQPPDRRLPVRTLAGNETGSDIPPGVEPSDRKAGTEGGINGPRSVDFRKEEPTRLTGSSPAHPPERRAVESSLAVDPVRGRDAVPAAPPGEKHRPAGEQAQLAPGTPFGPTKFLLDPLWEERSSLFDLTQEALRSVPGGPQDLSKGTLHRGSFTQRGSPLEIPSPFSGFAPVMGGAATGSGSSGGGVAPLLAVVASCLVALLYRGRSRIFCAVLRPGTVPRPALERPG